MVTKLKHRPQVCDSCSGASLDSGIINKALLST